MNTITKHSDNIERLFSKMTVVGDCWEWLGSKSTGGYGHLRKQHVSYKEGSVSAHRLSYESFIDEIPAGKVIDHLCRNHACFNPDHLEAVTQRENLLRGETITARNAAATHCPHGHEYTPENTSLLKGKWRACIACIKSRYSYRQTLNKQNMIDEWHF